MGVINQRKSLREMQQQLFDTRITLESMYTAPQIVQQPSVDTHSHQVPISKEPTPDDIVKEDEEHPSDSHRSEVMSVEDPTPIAQSSRNPFEAALLAQKAEETQLEQMETEPEKRSVFEQLFKKARETREKEEEGDSEVEWEELSSSEQSEAEDEDQGRSKLKTQINEIEQRIKNIQKLQAISGGKRTLRQVAMAVRFIVRTQLTIAKQKKEESRAGLQRLQPLFEALVKNLVTLRIQPVLRSLRRNENVSLGKIGNRGALTSILPWMAAGDASESQVNFVRVHIHKLCHILSEISQMELPDVLSSFLAFHLLESGACLIDYCLPGELELLRSQIDPITQCVTQWRECDTHMIILNLFALRGFIPVLLSSTDSSMNADQRRNTHRICAIFYRSIRETIASWYGIDQVQSEDPDSLMRIGVDSSHLISDDHSLFTITSSVISETIPVLTQFAAKMKAKIQQYRKEDEDSEQLSLLNELPQKRHSRESRVSHIHSRSRASQKEKMASQMESRRSSLTASIRSIHSSRKSQTTNQS